MGRCIMKQTRPIRSKAGRVYPLQLAAGGGDALDELLLEDQIQTIMGRQAMVAAAISCG